MSELEQLVRRADGLERFGDYDGAKEVMAHVLTLAPDLAEAYNMLGDWQRKRGELDKALHNYDVGTKALARRLVKRMRNSPEAPIVKHDEFAGELWMECALFGALWLAAEDGITDFAWPTGDAAMEEERTEKHRGLYFTDERRLLKRRRVYHPNYFASFRQWLKSEPIFEFLVGNQGLIHRAQGDEDLAQRRFAEAALFGRRRVSGRPASP